jgi:hypothetical protein
MIVEYQPCTVKKKTFFYRPKKCPDSRGKLETLAPRFVRVVAKREFLYK